MEFHFDKTTISCLDTAVREMQTMELTQEIKLSDGMPDIGRVLSAWGQVILRGKEWRSNTISFSGGIMVWVLYAPEDGTQERCLDTWIPFQMKWDLPEDSPEGSIRIQCLPRFVDARSVSPRKIMVRSGIAALAEAFVPFESSLYIPGSFPDNVELLKTAYPLRLFREAGEKTFLLEEDLLLPDSAPQPESLIYYRMNPRITEKRVLANKLVFRGTGNLHVLLRSEEGTLFSWDFELPFSQFAELDMEHSGDAQADIVLSPTALEMELDDEGQLRMKGGVTAQYVISDKQMVELIEDAYSINRELGIHTENLELPVVLENRRENIYGEQTLSAGAVRIADASFLPDFPRQRRMENGVEMEFPAGFQILYYDEDGMLRSGSLRWEGQHRMNADENSRISTIPVPVEPQTMIANGQILAKAELPFEMSATARQSIPMAAGVELGEARVPDQNRPTLILRRAGESRLWDIAKGSGSTVEAIRKANNLSSEPVPGQMLLIPVY